MIRTFFCCLLFMLILSCGNEKEVPAGILPQKEMQSVLWDVIRADMLVNYTAARDTSMNKFTKNIELYQQIFKLHGITKETFKRSIDYYRTHPVIMQTLFDSLYSKASKTVDTSKVAR